jgi:hypothetical protein
MCSPLRREWEGGREIQNVRLLRVARVRALLRERDPCLVKFSLKIEENDE